MNKKISHEEHADICDDSLENLQKELRTVRVDDVISKPQVRREFNGIEDLASSLLTEGQQTPIIVFPPNDQGKYVIQKGERRWRACKYANIPFIDVLINYQSQSDLDQTAGELIENIQREELTAIEIANALEAFVAQGWKQVDIARRIGKSQKFVSSYLGLGRLPECVLALYEKQVCTDVDTLNILRKLYEIDPESCKQVCGEAVRKGIYRSRCRELLVSCESILRASAATAGKSPPGSGAAVNAASEKYFFISPDSLTVEVMLRIGRRRTKGVLLLDRASASEDLAWVKVKSADGEEIHSIKASRLQVLRIKKSPSRE